MWFRAMTHLLARSPRQSSKSSALCRLRTRRLFLEGLEDRRLMAFDVLAEMTTGSGPHYLELAAIDSDSQVDLVTIEGGKVAIRLGTVDGSFGDPLTLAGEIAADGAITGDFNSDGATDLVTSLYSQTNQFSHIRLRFGNGDGSFQDPLPLELPFQRESAITGIGLYGQSLSGLATGDLNDDGKLDLVVGGATSFPIGHGYYSGYYNSYHGYVNVLLGTGAGTFNYVDADPSDAELNAYRLGALYQLPGSLAIADINNDGQRDVVLSKSLGGMATLLGNGTGTLQNPVHSGSGTGFSSVSLGDLDGDGNLDTLTQIGNGLIVGKGQGDGSFISGAVIDTGQELDSAVLGDVNSDGKLDLLAVGAALCDYYGYGCYDATRARQASVLLGDGHGGFSLPIASSLGTAIGSSSYLNDVKIADLTGDGLLDLVTIAYFFDGPAIVAANDGNWGSPEELAIADVTIVEGNSGSANAVFTVTLTGSASGPVTVDYVVFDYFDLGDNTAARVGVDYTAPAGTLTFAPGVLSRTITVPVIGDRLGEGNETFFVNLSNPVGALLRDAEAVGTIADNEPGISINHPLNLDPLTVIEGDFGTTPAVFTVTLSQPYDQDVTVDYFTSTGHTSDIIAATGTLRFAPGETTKTITVQVVGDLLDEVLEAFNVYLSSSSPNAYIDGGAAYCFIEDNDPTPAVSISDVSKNEGNSGTTKFTFTLTVSSPVQDGGFVEFATSNGTASASQDYTTKSGYVYFDPGQTTQTLNIDVKGDTSSEADETFFVNLINSGGTTIADGQGVGTIVNDDSGTPSGVPRISIGDAETIEGNSGTKLMTFTVSLSQASNKEVRVKYATANGTAKTGNSDYVATSGTLRFAAGETSKTITVTIKGDKKQENDEYFLVKLSSAVNGTIADSQGIGTILNDDSTTTALKKGGRHELAASSVDAAIDDWMSFGRKNRRR